MLNQKVVCIPWEYVTFVELVLIWILHLACGCCCACPGLASPFSTGFSTYLKAGSLVNAAVMLGLSCLVRIALLALPVSESTQMLVLSEP